MHLRSLMSNKIHVNNNLHQFRMQRARRYSYFRIICNHFLWRSVQFIKGQIPSLILCLSFHVKVIIFLNLVRKLNFCVSAVKKISFYYLCDRRFNRSLTTTRRKFQGHLIFLCIFFFFVILHLCYKLSHLLIIIVIYVVKIIFEYIE